MSPRSLSNRELHARTTRLVRREREICLEILDHLNEIERRKLHLELGFRSMFDYCTRGLGYSESAAGRRVQVARCMRQFPEVRKHIAGGDVNLSTVGLIASFVTRANKDALLRAISGKSQRDVEAIAVRFRPPIAIRDRVKPVRVVAISDPGVGKPEHSRCGSATGAGGAQPNHAEAESARSESDHARGGSTMRFVEDPRAGITSEPQNHSRCGSGKTPKSTPRIIEKMLIQFAASPDFMKKLEKVRSLLSTRTPAGVSFEMAFEAALDVLIEKHDPEAREARRAKRAAKKKNGTAERPKKTKKSRSSKARGMRAAKHGEPVARQQNEASRYIPPATRDAVYARDGGQCTYNGATGKRCGSRHNLRIDHIVPHALGGSSALSNLRLLCAQHNRLEAERVMGPAAGRFKRRKSWREPLPQRE